MPETIKKRPVRRTTKEEPAPEQEPVIADAPPAAVDIISADSTDAADAEKVEAAARRPERYFESVGRRKTAIARVRVYTRSGAFMVNTKPYGHYFPTLELQKIVEDALKKMKLWERFRISVMVSGGGIHAQAEAVRHGLARSLIKFNADFRKRLKRAGYLKRDPRMKERKKFGLKKARRAPQWQKR